MRTQRTLPTIALIAVATFGLTACVAVNETLTDRDLTCEATPDDLCLRVADVAVSDLSGRLDETRANPVTVTTVKVELTDCADIGRERTATRCWRVEATYIDGYSDIPLTAEIIPGEFGAWVYARPDGTLGVDY
jgi:hypothetical protein